MTITQQLKENLIATLDELKPDESIAIVDAKQREEIELPLVAIDISSVTAYSEALQNVQRIGMTLTLRVHSGDTDEEKIDDWINTFETALHDEDSIIGLISDRLKIHHWLYNGSSQDWDGEIVEVIFYCDCLASRD
jgi:hypothetical protein